MLLQSFNPLWFVVSAAGFLPPITVGFIYKIAYLNRRPEKSRPGLNLLVAAFAGSTRNLSVGLFALWANLDTSQLWLFRFFGGIVVGIAIFILLSLSQGTTTDYKSSLRKLASIQSDLAATREEMPELLQEVNENLQNRTKASVLPQLDAIYKALGETRSGEAAVSQLRETLAKEIRPLLEELAQQSPQPFKERDFQGLRKVKSTLPSRFRLYESMPILGAAVTQAIGYGFWLIFLYAGAGLVQSVIAIVVYGFVLFALKQFIPRNREFSKGVATSLIVVLSAVSSACVAIYLASLNIPLLTYLAVTGVSVFSGILAPVILAQTSARHNRQKEIEKRIAGELSAIAKENSLFAQKVWVFRKRWLLVLHGTVQSALTAAVTRLQNAPEIDEYTVQMVNQDLRRAEKAINSDEQTTIKFEEALAELKAVWSGICDLTIEISERAKRALLRNSDSAFCVNEIAKEAVSNAVRHGSASSAKILIDRVEDDTLHIEISNDGIAPRTREKPGIGSSMLDEICLNWYLEAKSRKVTLVADLPVRV